MRGWAPGAKEGVQGRWRLVTSSQQLPPFPLLLALLLLPVQVPLVAQGHWVAGRKVQLLRAVLGRAVAVVQSRMALQLLLAPVQLAALLTGVVAPLLSARAAVRAERRAQIGGGMRPLLAKMAGGAAALPPSRGTP